MIHTQDTSVLVVQADRAMRLEIALLSVCTVGEACQTFICPIHMRLPRVTSPGM